MDTQTMPGPQPTIEPIARNKLAKFFDPEAFLSPPALAIMLALIVGFVSDVAQWSYEWWFPILVSAALVLIGRVYWYVDVPAHPLRSPRTWPALVALWVLDSVVVLFLAVGGSSVIAPAGEVGIERRDLTVRSQEMAPHGGAVEVPSTGFRRLADPALF